VGFGNNLVLSESLAQLPVWLGGRHREATMELSKAWVDVFVLLGTFGGSDEREG
jgi:hypothetical protein